jgi:hypothetical protein
MARLLRKLARLLDRWADALDRPAANDQFEP